MVCLLSLYTSDNAVCNAVGRRSKSSGPRPRFEGLDCWKGGGTCTRIPVSASDSTTCGSVNWLRHGQRLRSEARTGSVTIWGRSPQLLNQILLTTCNQERCVSLGKNSHTRRKLVSCIAVWSYTSHSDSGYLIGGGLRTLDPSNRQNRSRRMSFAGDQFKRTTAIDIDGIAPADPDSVTTLCDNRLRLFASYTTAYQERGLGTDVQQISSVDACLARLCEAWPSLQEQVVLAILALVDSSPRVVEANGIRTLSRDSRRLRLPTVALRLARNRRPK